MHQVALLDADAVLAGQAAADLEAQLRVKDAFDPKWLLNPAKVFPLATSASRRAA